MNSLRWKGKWSLLAGTAALSLATPIAVRAADASIESGVILSTGVVLAPAARLAFIAAPRGELQAVHTGDGSTAWLSDRHGLPLALAQGHLLVLAHDAPKGGGLLWLLDPATGELQDSLQFSVPEGVHASATPQPQRRFSVTTVAQGNGLRLYWEYQERPLQGALLVDEGGAADDSAPPAPKVVSGAVDLNLGTPRARTVADPPAAPLWIPNLQESERVAGLTGTQFRAADDLHIQTSTAVDDPLFGTLWKWSIHTRSGSDRVGGLKLPHSIAPFMVTGDQLVTRLEPYAYRLSSGRYQSYVTRLASFDLDNGAELWSVDVQDLDFKGVMPP